MQLHITLNQTTYHLHRPTDLDTLWESMAEDDLDADERIPYWVEVWPAAILLAKWLLSHQELLAGIRCLDLGCGLGLSTQVAASCGAKVVGVDYELEALRWARHSMPDGSVSWAGMDWRRPCFRAHSFSLIFGADIMYEKRFFTPLLRMWERILKPGGRIWITAPDRQVSRPFLHSILPRSGWRVQECTTEPITFAGFQQMEVTLWEIRRRDQLVSRA